jgi:uncharacterized protein YcbK (DUF882 family)
MCTLRASSGGPILSVLSAMEFALDPQLPPRRHVPRSRFERAGLNPQQERWFNLISAALVVLFVIGWGFTLVRAIRTGETPPLLSGGVSDAATPQTAYLLDAALRGFTRDTYRGQSGAVRVIVQAPGDTLTAPDSLPAGAQLRYGASPTDTAAAPTPRGPGVWNLMVAIKGAVRSVPDLNVLTLVPLSEKRSGRIGTYLIGSWPYEKGGRPRSPQYAPPRGLVRVTPDNLNLQVSEHFRLRDFVTKGQVNVWPKYVAMSPRLLDKLELTIQELNASGIPAQHVGTISGFRTPNYNAEGGNTGGRGALSRHMYGDAMDWYVDNDRNGSMDDLNKDGRVNKEDGRVIGKAAERVEKKYPDLIGGIGLYSPTGAHDGFVHIDTRGYRARWGW